jgi:hypothetical protein
MILLDSNNITGSLNRQTELFSELIDIVILMNNIIVQYLLFDTIFIFDIYYNICCVIILFVQ